MEGLVSAIVPVYKVEEYLDRCLESIVNQTYKNLEIIIVDDGSPDSCPQRCDEWARKDSRIKVIHKKNQGVSSARNTGLDNATGEYILFIDSDDFLPLDAIAVMLGRIEQDNSDMVVAQRVKVYQNGDAEVLDNPGMNDMIIRKEEALHMLGSTEKSFSTALWAKLYRGFIFSELRFEELEIGEDTCAAPYIIDQCELISIMGTVVYYYFQRETSAVHAITRKKHLDGIKAVVQVARFLYDRGYLREAKVYYCSAVCRYIDTKYDKEARRIITDTFTCGERGVLRKQDWRAWATVLVHMFPRIYKMYRSAKE